MEHLVQNQRSAFLQFRNSFSFNRMRMEREVEIQLRTILRTEFLSWLLKRCRIFRESATIPTEERPDEFRSALTV